MRISDWSSDVCSSDLVGAVAALGRTRINDGHRSGCPGDGAALQRAGIQGQQGGLAFYIHSLQSIDACRHNGAPGQLDEIVDRDIDGALIALQIGQAAYALAVDRKSVV